MALPSGHGANDAATCVEALADVLIDCVEGGASESFMWPISRDKALGFWREVAASVARGERVLLVAEDGAGRIMGTVQMITTQAENQPHRADIAKMLVHRSARRNGVGQRLMAEIERAAQAAQKSGLVLDTETGCTAAR